jgi:hypothetical protein
VAMALHRGALAGCGFQFGSPPLNPSQSPPRGIASIWSAGEPHAGIYEAATPALALLRATATESARRIDARTMARCSVCGGLGWFVTSGNRKQICQHGHQTGCVEATPTALPSVP